MAVNHVNPGDLIQAQDLNDMADAVDALATDVHHIDTQVQALITDLTALTARVAALEQQLSPPPKAKDTKEKEKDTKEGKDVKDTPEGKGPKLESKEIVLDKVRVFEGGGKLLASEGAGKLQVVDVREKGVQKVTDVGRTFGPGRFSEPLQHFIPSALRPDLTRSALIGEEDLNGSDSGGVPVVVGDGASRGSAT